MAKDEWKKVEVNVTSGNYWKKEEQKEIEGILTKKIEHSGSFNKPLYVLETPDHETINVNGSTQLDRAMLQVEIGSEIKIEYLGKQKSAKGNYFDAYNVFVK